MQSDKFPRLTGEQLEKNGIKVSGKKGGEMENIWCAGTELPPHRLHFLSSPATPGINAPCGFRSQLHSLFFFPSTAHPLPLANPYASSALSLKKCDVALFNFHDRRLKKNNNDEFIKALQQRETKGVFPSIQLSKLQIIFGKHQQARVKLPAHQHAGVQI